MVGIITHICGTFLKNQQVRKVNELVQINVFDRVRMITIHDGYISCSCGGVYMYLIPCRHVCAIITKK